MKKFIETLCFIINIYIYYVVICCFLTWIPNLNMDYPTFKIMFWLAGFNILANIPILHSFVPVFLICILIAVRKLLYKSIGEKDKFFDYETTQKTKETETETETETDINKEEGINNDNDNTGSGSKHN